MERKNKGVMNKMARMTKQEILNKLEESDGFCDYCQHILTCEGRVVCYGGEPLFPPCADTDYELLIDFETYAEDYEIELAEENMEKYTQENIKKAYDTLCNESGTTPVHYNTKIQPVEFMESNFSFEQMRGAYKFNIIKYISRYEKKDGLKDLHKAKDYLEMLIKLEEGENGND